MVSELRVDKIHNEGGDNDSGIDLSTNDQIVLKTANTTRLTMNATGQTTIVGEGGTNTTNLQQGIAKSWVLGTNSAGLTDSFNVSGGTDNGTGDYSYAVSTNFGNANFSAVPTGAEDNTRIAWNKVRATSSYRISFADNNGTEQDAANAVTVHGDLS